jgi:hypothetical protein
VEKPQTKPSLQRIIEAVASIMDLGEGHKRLELIFQDGHLIKYYVHTAAKPRDLDVFEERARRILRA